MIDPETLGRSLPFAMAHGDALFNYHLDQTTPDLLKLQLHDHYRTKLQELKLFDNDDLHLLNGQFVDLQFNIHLQQQLDSGEIALGVPLLTLLLSLDDDDQFDLDEFVDKASTNPNYMNLKVLIEHLLFDTHKLTKDAILLLAALNQLKQHLQTKRDLQGYLLNKMTVLLQFIRLIVDQQLLDAALLLKILKLYLDLQTQLRDATREVELAQHKLNHHNLACLVLGYVEDVRMSAPSGELQRLQLVGPGPRAPARELVLLLFDLLFSHIAAIAAQRNVLLPPPPLPIVELLELKTKWAQECIDAVLATQPPDALVTGVPPLPLKDELPDAQLAHYKTALNDLRFSHQYLVKEYELLRELAQKLITDYRKRIALLETQVALQELAAADVSYTHDLDAVDQKDREIARLRKELSLLKVDRAGLTTPHPMFSLLPLMLHAAELPFSSSANVAILPIRELALPDTEDDALLTLLATGPRHGTSAGILRKEFKKIVADIHEQYEVSLGEERIRRRKLQEELEKLRET